MNDAITNMEATRDKRKPVIIEEFGRVEAPDKNQRLHDRWEYDIKRLWNAHWATERELRKLRRKADLQYYFSIALTAVVVSIVTFLIIR